MHLFVYDDEYVFPFSRKRRSHISAHQFHCAINSIWLGVAGKPRRASPVRVLSVKQRVDLKAGRDMANGYLDLVD